MSSVWAPTNLTFIKMQVRGKEYVLYYISLIVFNSTET